MNNVVANALCASRIEANSLGQLLDQHMVERFRWYGFPLSAGCCTAVL